MKSNNSTRLLLQNYELFPVSLDFHPHTKLWHWLIALLSCAVILLGFIAAENAFRHPFTRLLQFKTGYLATTEQYYDVIFIGTSLTLRQLDVTLSNDKDSGCHFSAYNAGIAGLTPLEFRDFMNALRENQSGRSFHIVIDMEMLSRPYRVEDESLRSTWYKRGKNFDLAWPFFQKENPSLGEYRQFFYRFFLNSIRTGQASLWLTDTSVSPRKPSRGGRYSGYSPTEKIISSRARIMKEKRLARAYQTGIEGFNPDISWPQKSLIEKIITEVKNSGGTPVLLFMPKDKYAGNIIAYVRMHYPEIPILDYNIFSYPEFSDIDVWADHRHLNEKGARVLSQRVYRDLCNLKKLH